MTTIEARVVIHKTPQQICNFIIHLDKNDYLKWHPNHVDFKAIKRTDNIVGSVLNFEENIAGIHLNYNWVIEEYQENRKFLLKAKYIMPITLLLEFTPKEAKEGKEGMETEVLQRISIGFENASKKIIDPLIKLAFINDKQKEEIQQHFREEFKNLEKII